MISTKNAKKRSSRYTIILLLIQLKHLQHLLQYYLTIRPTSWAETILRYGTYSELFILGVVCNNYRIRFIFRINRQLGMIILRNMMVIRSRVTAIVHGYIWIMWIRRWSIHSRVTIVWRGSHIHWLVVLRCILKVTKT